MTREERRKQKEYARKVKEINNSLSFLSKEKQSELGVVSVQQEEDVFYCGGNCYKKIYMFYPASLGNKRIAFIKALTDRFNNRIRFSISTRNYKGKLSAYMFMTVFFDADEFLGAYQEIRKFEKTLSNEICMFLGITIKPCTVENVLTFIWMNFSGEMKKIPSEVLFSRTDKVIDSLSGCSSGNFDAAGRYGRVFVGKNYPEEIDRVNDFMMLHEGSYYIVVDFQGFTEEEQHLFDFEIRNRYSLHNEVEKPHFINMTYLFSVIGSSREYVKGVCDEAYRFYDNKGIQLMPGIGREQEIFASSCSLGLLDFHSMQNSSEDIIGGLLL